MKGVVRNIEVLADSYVFSDIIMNPPKPYEYLKANISAEFAKINTNEERHFYEFYRDIRKAFSVLSDTNFDIIGSEIPFINDTVNFGAYTYCLPFKFYLDYEDNSDVKIYIKEFPHCSRNYNASVKEYIAEHQNISVEEINGKNAFDYIQDFGSEFFKFKNKNSQFQIIIDSIHYNRLVFVPLLPKELNSIEILFSNNDSFTTSFYVNKKDYTNKKNKPKNNFSKEMKKENIIEIKENLENIKNHQLNEKESNDEIKWMYQTQNGELKCRVDITNSLNVIFIKTFDIEPMEELQILSNCFNYFYAYRYPILVITSQNWEGNNFASYIFTQLLQPKIPHKYKFAMKQTDLNRELFESNIKGFLNARTCSPFDSWEDFIETTPDEYGEISHSRSKLFTTIPEDYFEGLEKLRKIYESFAYMKKKPTDILILTDTVSYGAASNFIKSLQNYGGAIVASYGGNPYLNKSNLVFDASLEPIDSTIYEDSKVFNELKQYGFQIYNIPYAENFENLEGDKYPMDFKVNSVDEETNIQ